MRLREGAYRSGEMVEHRDREGQSGDSEREFGLNNEFSESAWGEV